MDWIKNISDAIGSVFQKVRQIPVKPIPSILLLCEIMNRPGLSALAITGATVSRLQTNYFPTGKAPCGLDNMNNEMVKTIAEEFVKHFKFSAKIENTGQPMDISFIGTGGNAGGPIVMNLYNNNYPQFGGIGE